MSSPIVAFSLDADQHALIEGAAATHRLSVAAWIKSVALELATTTAQNRATRTARRTARKTPTP